MFLLDSLMISGIRWAIETTITAAEAEMNDDTALREQLLAAQMRADLGELGEEEFAALEADILARLREIRERRQGSGPAALSPSDYRITGIEATVEGDEHR